MPLAVTNAPDLLADVTDLDGLKPVLQPVVRPRRAATTDADARPLLGPARIVPSRRWNDQGAARRPGREQGRALELLGHAVEYLIDSRMFLTGIAYTRSEEQALQMLMAASREVFEGCPVKVGFGAAAKSWLVRGWRSISQLPV